MSRRRLAAVLTLGLASTPLVGCDEHPVALTACQTAAQETPSIELSSGYDSFEAVEDGGYLPAYSGVQGGAHAYVGVRVSGVNPGNRLDPASAPLVLWDAWNGDEHVGSGFTHEQLEEFQSGHEINGAMMFVDTEYASWGGTDELPPAETVELVLTVEDVCGTVLEETLSVYLGNRYQPED
jgi:hypothetical protein